MISETTPPPPPPPPSLKRSLSTDAATQPKTRQKTKHDNWTEKTKHSVAKLQLIRNNPVPPAGLLVIAVADQDHIPILHEECYLKLDPESAKHAPKGKWSVWPYKDHGVYEERRIEYNAKPHPKIKGRQVRLTGNTEWSAVHINDPNGFAALVASPGMHFSLPANDSVATTSVGDVVVPPSLFPPLTGKQEEEQDFFQAILDTQALQEKATRLERKLQAKINELQAKVNELEAKNRELEQNPRAYEL